MLKLVLGIATFSFSTVLYASTIWLDVRSEREFEQDHIQGHTRVDHTQVKKYVEAEIPEKSTQINLYCRSGRRASIAMNALQMAGYTNVTNVGGIADARAAIAAAASEIPVEAAIPESAPDAVTAIAPQ